MKKLIIVGASGHGKVIADIAILMKRWDKIVFLDDNEELKKCSCFSVIGKVSDAYKYKENSDFFIAIGNNVRRKEIQEQFEKNNFNMATLIHPHSVIGSDVTIMSGTVIMAGVIINSSVTIGRGCIINTSSSIDHDSKLGDFVHISPGARIAGTVNIEGYCWLGIGSIVINNIKICSGSIVGAGTVVINDIISPGTYVGVPGRRID